MRKTTIALVTLAAVTLTGCSGGEDSFVNRLSSVFSGPGAVQDDVQIQAAFSGLDFPSVIDAHKKWKDRLQTYVDGTSKEELDASKISVDNACAMGKWIYGDGQKSYTSIEKFQELRQLHKEFHRAAGSVVERVQEGKRTEAQDIIDGVYTVKSTRIIGVLEDLQSQVYAGKKTAGQAPAAVTATPAPAAAVTATPAVEAPKTAAPVAEVKPTEKK